jgi:hypothetical protein
MGRSLSPEQKTTLVPGPLERDEKSLSRNPGQAELTS